ncbi:hypothetical protein PLANTIT3_60222 [Plantibacter sp. T3]|nr:hypothetical protein PLANTIT3_60222 [Plantibacter sp. T3]
MSAGLRRVAPTSLTRGEAYTAPLASAHRADAHTLALASAHRTEPGWGGPREGARPRDLVGAPRRIAA